VFPRAGTGLALAVYTRARSAKKSEAKKKPKQNTQILFRFQSTRRPTSIFPFTIYCDCLHLRVLLYFLLLPISVDQ